MNIERKRHKLLKILSNKRNTFDLNSSKNKAIGVTFDDICDELNCSETSLKLVTSELYTSEEIGFHNAHDIIGLCVKDKGLTAYANKKYLKKYWKNITDITKSFVQILIPILSLVIAIIALTIKFNQISKSMNNKLENLDKKIEQINEQIFQLRIEKKPKLDTLNK